jgi:hypothetical protein
VNDEVAASSALCKNCGTLLTGRYCVNCSQAADVHVPTTRELMHELAEGLTHGDSRLWRTLTCLWFKPGRLTQEFIAGRRVAYLPPFRLYLVLSVIFFLIASFTPIGGEAVHFDDAAAKDGSKVSNCDDINVTGFLSSPEWTQRARHACAQVVRDNGASLMHVAIATMPKAMFIFLPLVAFLHMLMYWRPRYRYAEHLLFFVHLHAFFFSVMALRFLASDAAAQWPVLHRPSDILETLVGWTMVLYTAVALRRVFTKSWPGTLFKGFALFLVYMVVFAITMAGVFVYALLQL